MTEIGLFLMNTCPTGIRPHDEKRRYGLISEIEAIRVADYAENMIKKVGMVAHFCGNPEPRRLERFHARVVLGGGFTKPLDEVCTEPSAAVPTELHGAG